MVISLWQGLIMATACLTAEKFLASSMYEQYETNYGKQFHLRKVFVSTMKHLLFKLVKECIAWVKALWRMSMFWYHLSLVNFMRTLSSRSRSTGHPGQRSNLRLTPEEALWWFNRCWSNHYRFNGLKVLRKTCIGDKRTIAQCRSSIGGEHRMETNKATIQIIVVILPHNDIVYVGNNRLKMEL